MTPHWTKPSDSLRRQMLMGLLYRCLLAAAFPFLLLYVALRVGRDRRYARHLRERFGQLPLFSRTNPGGIWLHGVSVGELLTARPLLERLRREQPTRPLWLSCGTLAGRHVLETQLAGVTDAVFYLPFDYPAFVRRVFRQVRPSLLLVLETELWPALYREAERHGCRLLIANARISDRALPRYARLRWFLPSVFRSVDSILAQSEPDAERFRHLGAPAEIVTSAGNLKYDFDPATVRVPEPVAALVTRLRPSLVLLAASLMPPLREGDVDELTVILSAFRDLAAQHDRLLLVLVPRKPETFDAAAEALRDAGLPFARRTSLTPATTLPLPGVLLLDTMGELAGTFAVADVVFVGGTLARRGGHNVLEPAAFGKAILVGPHMENFREIADRCLRSDAIRMVHRAEDLTPALGRLLAHPEERLALGARARFMAESQRGATERVLTTAAALAAEAIPRRPHSLLATAALRPLSLAWGAAARWNGARLRAASRRLSTPVVSVGGIAMGGVGKTPFVLFLAERLTTHGLRVAVLTRGYRRHTQEASTVLPRGSCAPTRLTGDEAQLLLRSGLVDLGIGADRWATGQLVEAQCRPDVFLLDDGFQHQRLHRDADLVLIDSLDPIAGGTVFPEGRLREPLDGLQRADAFVVTRTRPGTPTTGIEQLLRGMREDAPIHRSSVAPVGNPAAASLPAFAFCGLANPDAFWQTLDNMGQPVVGRATFPDHHRYTAGEIADLTRRAHAAGAGVLLTTEKDAVNLPNGLVPALPIRSLAVRVSVEREPELIRWLLDRLHL